MTSYVVNPSKKVTEILSEFLEFDPDQLQLGIWSGDLSIKDVSLKREAIQSLFAQKLQQSTCGKDLLKLSLIKGQIGHMRIQIPWKRLVWGSGDVRLTISDVDIVLAFEKCCPDQKTSEESGDNEELPETTRERKQSCLQEAERLQLQGLPIPRVFESFQDQSYPELSDSPDSKQKQQEPQINNPAGRLDSWMKQATSSIVWRFFAGLQATIRNVRVVIVQDGVEVGLIQHSMNVVATHNAHDGEHATETTQQTSDNSNQPSEFGGDEAGEHVDKTVDVQGFAVFIREIPTNPLLVSPQLKFSSSVNADDYILRPTNSKLSFSFFYPHPPGTPKKRKQPADDTATRASEDGSKTTTSKTRRGKRDKRSNKQQQEYMQPLKLHRVASEAGVSVFDKPSNLRRSTVFTPEGGGSDALVPDMSELIRQDQTKRQHHRRIASGSKMFGNKTSYSTAETSAKSALPTVMEQDHSPHVDLHLAFGEIKTVFSSKHYNLVLMMVSFIKRMQNGRPDKSIGEFLDDDESDKAKSIVVDVSPDTPDAFPVPAPFSAKSTSLAATTPNIPPPLHNFPPPPPSAPLIRYHSDFVMARKTRKQVHLSLQLQPKLRSAKSRVIKEWWEYAYRIVSKEVSKKRQEKAHFCGSTFHFSWNAQKRRRQEYINLYISNRLEKSSVLHHMEFHALPSVRQAEETLLQIEDELPIEQILLYRSIARALRVQGRKSMPYSVLSFRQDQRGLTRQSSLGTQQAPSTSHKRTKRRGSAFQRAQDNGTAMKSAASSIGLEKDPAALGELKRLCSEARVRRSTESGNDSAKQPPTPANLFSPLSTKTLGKRRLFREDSDRHVNFGLNRKSSFGTMDAARMSSEDLDSSIRGTPVKTVVASDDKTFTYRTAKSSSSNTNFSNTVPVQSNTAVQVRFSFALKVEQLELLVFSDENYLRMVRGQQDFSDFSSSATAGSRESKLQLQPNLHLFADGDSSDGISDISASSEEAEFFESNDANISFVEAESDDHPILSSNDFLTFGLPNDVILKVSISPLSFSHRGLSGGAKKFSFGIGSVIATGEHALKLLSIGTCDPKSFHEGHFLNPFEEIQLRKKSFNATNMKHSIGNFSVRPNDEALKASLVQLENGKSFLEVDIAKIVATAEIKAILSIQTFVSETVVLLPKPMLGRTEIDEVRDYVLQRSQTPKPFFLDQFNCAFRLHGIDVTVPNGVLEPNEGGGESENGEKVDSRPKMKAVVRLVEYYNGRLVDHIVSVSQESMGDDATKYSSAMKSRVSAQSSVDWGGAFVSDGRMKLLDLSELMKKHDSLTSNHSIMKVGGMDCFFQTTSEPILGWLPQNFALLKETVDIEVLFTKHQTSNGQLGHHRQNKQKHAQNEVSIAASALSLQIDENNLSLSLSLAQFVASKNILDRTAGTSAGTHLPPRLILLSNVWQLSMDFSIVGVEVAILANSSKRRRNTFSFAEKEIVMEECIADYLSVVACFNLANPSREAIHVAHKTCTDRLYQLGLSEQAAAECAEAARQQLLSDIELVRRTQKQTLYELSSNQLDMTNEKLTKRELNPDEDQTLLDSEDASVITDGDSAMDGNSQESVDIIETALRNAAERIITSYITLLEGDGFELSDDTLAVVTMNLWQGFHISLSKYVYDHHLNIHIPSLCVRETSGVKLVEVGLPSILADERFEEIPNDRGIVISTFEVDSEHGFAAGGDGLLVLGLEVPPIATKRDRQMLNDVAVCNIDVLICERALSHVVDSLKEVAEKIKLSGTKKGKAKGKNRTVVESTVCIAANRASFVLTSNELNPFSRIILDEVLCQMNINSSDEKPLIDLSAADVALLNLTPEGQHFRDFLVGIESSRTLVNKKLRVKFFPSKSLWKNCSLVDVDVFSVRIILVRQFLNEMLQFCLAPEYGIGRLMVKYLSKLPYDESGNPPPPMHFKVSIHDSSVFIPRSSISVDMIALETKLITLCNSFHRESFSMPKGDRNLDKSPPVSFDDKSRQNSKRAVRSSAYGSIDQEFFDCNQSLDEPAQYSAYQRDLLRRTNVKIIGARIFASVCPIRMAANVSSGVDFLHYFILNDRPETGKPVFAFKPNLKTPEQRSEYSSIIERSWEEITCNEVSLEILADYAPHLRLLITDRVDDVLPVSSLNLNARMSQFYLLLSTWYSNMQEMPVLFPYDINQVKRFATFSSPPDDFPEYGTDEYVECLKDLSKVRSEIMCLLEGLSMTCAFDREGYHGTDPDCFEFLPPRMKRGKGHVLKLSLDDIALHVTSDDDGILRVACGAAQFQLDDERKTEFCKKVFKARCHNNNDPSVELRSNVWADLQWGLSNRGHSLNDKLSMAFQVTVFMTPNWCLINFGLDNADAVMFDFSPIWILLDYFSCYFSDPKFGNPFFEAEAHKDKLKEKLSRESGQNVLVPATEKTSLNIDFRLWLLKPFLAVPSETTLQKSPSILVTSKTGFWYKYKSLGTFSSQEMGSSNLSLFYSDGYLDPETARPDVESLWDSQSPSRNLISGLSFGLRMDFNSRTNHTDYAFKMPFWEPKGESKFCGIASDEIEVQPVTLQPPLVCTPPKQPIRVLGFTVCEMTLLFDVIPKTIELFLRLISGSNDDVIQDSAEIIPNEHSGGGEEEINGDPSFTVCADVNGLRLFVLDPILGMHLPIAVASVASLKVSTSQLGLPINEYPALRRESPPSDLQVLVETNFWADYFKLGVTRSWEPLVEPFTCTILYEKSKRRGQGLSLQSEVPFHMNITGAFLLTLEDTINSLMRSVREMFGDANDSPQQSCNNSVVDFSDCHIEQKLLAACGNEFDVKHSLPKPMSGNDRVAFSLMNMTGQRLRVHQLSSDNDADKKLVGYVTYLNHKETTRLDFEATISVVRNMRLVEVPFPGLPLSQMDTQTHRTRSHAVDVQLPGFKWLQGLSVNSSGRKFDDLVPRDPMVRSKVSNDWRLENTMKLLTEVGYENGGRLITVRSLFEIRNHTSHSLFLRLNPDPTHKPPISHKTRNALGPIPECDDSFVEPIEEDEEIPLDPGGEFQLPSLLLESALKLEGNHLGCLWVRPETAKENRSLYESLVLGDDVNLDETMVGFSSRPVQLAKVVHESALLFHAGQSEDLPPDKVRSGVQVSCPIAEGIDGVALAPFCYAIEIRRSPIVRYRQPEGGLGEKRVQFARGRPKIGGSIGESHPSKKGKLKDSETRNLPHCPISYSLVIHPPIIIDNLLPAEGRFELMHATRRTVLWYGDLKPGDKVPVHTVGLDAPLLLLVNLGFCRTPVGEGALVHHGSEAKGAPAQQGGIKSIGKAVTKGTKHIGKTLTSISDSPDARGKGKLFQIQNQQVQQKNTPKKKGKESNATNPGESLGLDNGLAGGDADKSNVHVVDSRSYTNEEIATETVVVDSVGQRLNLRIENVRGGGGQRRISLFCPFWIVNTTDHALRYKQDKSSQYVSGTVVSPEHDGSRPVDGSKRSKPAPRRVRFRKRGKRATTTRPISAPANPVATNQDTVFGGTPGALANSPGRYSVSREELGSLLEKDLPLGKLASIAFMFNFHEDVLILGHQKLVVQLADGTGRSKYTSDWSHGFSLDTIGVPQSVGMHCKDGRVLEVSATVTVAPGFLSTYTKIVRFTPKYIIVNRLPHPIRLWQDSSLVHSIFEDNRGNTENSTREGGRWHFRSATDSKDAVNQYEVLFGRAAAVEERVEEGSTMGTTAHKSALFVTTVGSGELMPCHLPDTRGDRQFRIDLGNGWNLTSSFDADVTGEHTLKVSRASNLRLIRHVNTRASPHYKVVLPPNDDSDWDGELGVWFETSWGGDGNILVKGTKRGRYSFNNTDIHVGDELLRIDDINVTQLTFAETMKLLKDRVSYVKAKRGDTLSDISRRPRALLRMNRKANRPPNERPEGSMNARLVLTFRTLEERLRRVRLKASRRRKMSGPAARNSSGGESSGDRAVLDLTTDAKLGQDSNEGEQSIKVEMRAIHNSRFLVVREQSKESPPYRIENRAMNHFIFFRQRGCTGHPWNILKPGETKDYCWEEPMKSHKLTVRVGSINIHLYGEESQDELLSHMDDDDDSIAFDVDNIEKAARRARLKQILSFHYVDGEDETTGFGSATTVKLEEIGFNTYLPCPKRIDQSATKHDDDLSCRVDSDGATRVLVISDFKVTGGERNMMQKHIFTLNSFIHKEENKIRSYQALQRFVVSGVRNPFSVAEEKTEEGVYPKMMNDNSSVDFPSEQFSADRLSHIESEATELADFPEGTTIWRRHQLVVQVVEAIGLQPTEVTGYCNPYCEVVLKGRSKKKRSLFSSRTIRRKSYFMEKTLAPRWLDQTFVFDVPTEAANVTRGHSVQVRLRSFRHVGQHPYLGQTNVHLRSLRNQKELMGWYPLVGRTGTGRRDLEDSEANWGRGSVKLRVQWIYTIPALVDYFLMLSERRLGELQRSADGMKKQLHHVIQSEMRKEQLKDHEKTTTLLKQPFGIASKLISGQRKTFRPAAMVRESLTSGIIDRSSPRSALFNLREPMKSSRDKLMWLFHFQTAESKRSRRRDASENPERVPVRKPFVTRERLESISEFSHFGSIDGELSITSPRGLASSLSDHEFAELVGEDVAHRELQLIEDQFESLSDAGRNSDSIPTRRQRSFSLDELARAHNVSEEVRAFTSRAQMLSRNSFSFVEDFDQTGVQLETGSGPAALSLEQEDRNKSLSDLVAKGLAYHGGDVLFHQRHLTYHFRLSLLGEVLEAATRVKSLQRVSPITAQFKSWAIAQAVLNDPDIDATVTNSHFMFCRAKMPKKEGIASLSTKSSFSEDFEEGSCHEFVKGKFEIPVYSLQSMRIRSEARAEDLYIARNRFERACKRSLRAVLNPGGWLTVRPMTALNLPDLYTGMSIKLRYGSYTLSTETVDAKAVPTWTVEEDPMARYRSSSRNLLPVNSLQSGGNEEDLHRANDLSIPVDPQKTSGSIRISVVGERLNAKVEVGVLDIPLGAAISCCVECMENAVEGVGDTGSDETPMYVRWFPLMNPKDSVRIDGDMGYSARPLESEKESDTLFSQYFSPCVKLALIWRPSKKDEADPSAFSSDEQHLRSIGDDEDWYRHLESPLTDLYFNADVVRVSAALIDSQRALELLALTASDIDVRYSVSKAKTRIGFVIGWIQIDHQVEGTREPVVLAPTPVLHPDPTLQFLAFKDNLRSKGHIDSYELIAFYMEALDITIEESWLFDIWEFLISIVRRREVRRKSFGTQESKREGRELMDSQFNTLQDTELSFTPLLELLWQDDNSESKTYIEKLYLGPVNLNLSYFKGKQRTAWGTNERILLNAVDNLALPEVVITASGLSFGSADPQNQSEIFSRWSEKTHDEDLWTESGDGKKSINLPNLIAAVLPSVSEAPIRLQGKGITHVFESFDEILNSVKNYYVNETLKQIYKIVGSLDFVGNPTMVLNSFVSGVRDFFIAPSKEFMRSPKNPSRVGIGVAKGTLSLLSHSASGLFGFAAKMTATAGQAAATLSFDAEYQQWHRDMIVAEAKSLDRQWKRRGVGEVSNILTRPLFDIVRGVALGATGLIISPIKGAKKEGGIGFAKGIVIGTVGVLTKPIVGIFDAFTHFTGSIHDVAKSVNVLEKRYAPAKKVRLPYTFGLRNVLVPFNPLTARSVALLHKHQISKKALRSKISEALASIEVHVASEILIMEPGIETVVVVSNLRIVLIKVKKDNNGAVTSNLCWEVLLFGQSRINSRVQEHGHNGVALTISKSLPSSSGQNKLAVGRRDLTKLEMSETAATGRVSDFHNANEGQDSFRSDDYEDSNHGDAILGDGNLYQTTEIQGEEETEWFTVLAEFHHRRQLSRLHNAICCVTGDLERIIKDRGLSKDGSGQGYTRFGEFYFSEETEDTMKFDFSTSGQFIFDEMEFVPWVPEVFFKENAQSATHERCLRFAETRRNWSLEEEIKSSCHDEGPEWMLKAKANGIFVAEKPPDLPADVPLTRYFQTVFIRLNRGEISYNDAVVLVRDELDSEGNLLMREESEAQMTPKNTNEDEATLPKRSSRRVLSVESFDVVPNSVYGRHHEASSLLQDESGQFQALGLGGHLSNHNTNKQLDIETIEEMPSHSTESTGGDFLSSGELPSSSKAGDRKTPKMLHDEFAFTTGVSSMPRPSHDSSPSSLAQSKRPSLTVSFDKVPSVGSDSGENRPRLPTSGSEMSDAFQSVEGHADGSTEGQSTNTGSNLPNTRLDKVEGMLEKLLELSLQQVERESAPPSRPFVQQEPSSYLAYLEVQRELTEMKQHMAEHEAGESTAVSNLKEELAELRELLNRQNQTIAGSPGTVVGSPHSLQTGTNADTARKSNARGPIKIGKKIRRVFGKKSSTSTKRPAKPKRSPIANSSFDVSRSDSGIDVSIRTGSDGDQTPPNERHMSILSADDKSFGE